MQSVEIKDGKVICVTCQYAERDAILCMATAKGPANVDAI